MSVSDKVLKLAFQGEWNTLLPILRDYPDLVNHPSEPKGYTQLHQAAWHGANLSVIGELLSIGADRSATTNAKRQTAYDIVVEKHKRPDPQYLLFPQKLTIAQILRKVVSTERQLFTDYDGNQILVDKKIAASGAEQCPDEPNELIRAVVSKAYLVAGHLADLFMLAVLFFSKVYSMVRCFYVR